MDSKAATEKSARIKERMASPEAAVTVVFHFSIESSALLVYLSAQNDGFQRCGQRRPAMQNRAGSTGGAGRPSGLSPTTSSTSGAPWKSKQPPDHCSTSVSGTRRKDQERRAAKRRRGNE
jgi:hypothetical protein